MSMLLSGGELNKNALSKNSHKCMLYVINDLNEFSTNSL